MQDNYFNEEDTKILLLKYYKNNDEKILNDLIINLKPIILGMINKCFSYNSYVKDNYEDVYQECLLNIFLVLKNKKIKLQKGKIFSYINRVVKNTILVFDIKTRKYEENIIPFNTLSVNLNDQDKDESDFDDMIDTMYNETNYFSDIKNEGIIKNELVSITLIYIRLKELNKYLNIIDKDEFFNSLKYNDNTNEKLDYLYYSELIEDLKEFISDIIFKFECRSNYFKKINKNIDYYLTNKNFIFPVKLFRKILKTGDNKYFTKIKKINKNDKNCYINLLKLLLESQTQ